MATIRIGTGSRVNPSAITKGPKPTASTTRRPKPCNCGRK